jgi:hypothetical protein
MYLSFLNHYLLELYTSLAGGERGATEISFLLPEASAIIPGWTQDGL